MGFDRDGAGAHLRHQPCAKRAHCSSLIERTRKLRSRLQHLNTRVRLPLTRRRPEQGCNTPHAQHLCSVQCLQAANISPGKQLPCTLHARTCIAPISSVCSRGCGLAHLLHRDRLHASALQPASSSAPAPLLQPSSLRRHGRTTCCAMQLWQDFASSCKQHRGGVAGHPQPLHATTHNHSTIKQLLSRSTSLLGPNT